MPLARHQTVVMTTKRRNDNNSWDDMSAGSNNGISTQMTIVTNGCIVDCHKTRGLNMDSAYVRAGAGAVGLGIVTGVAFYSSAMHNAEKINVGYEATDRVVACAEYLGQTTMNIAAVKETCPTETFAVTGQSQGNDGTHTVTVKYPAPADYLSKAYDPAKAIDQKTRANYQFQSGKDAFAVGLVGAAVGGTTVLFAEAIVIANKRRKAEKTAAAESTITDQ